MSTSSKLSTPIQFIKGVGPRISALLKKRDIETVSDVLGCFPRAYEDRSRFQQISELKDGETSTLIVRYQTSKKIPLRNGKVLFEVKCADDTGTLTLKWFHFYRALQQKITAGDFYVTGKVKIFRGQPEIFHPEISDRTVSSPRDTKPSKGANVGRVIPIYSQIEGLTSRQLRTILWNSLNLCEREFSEDIPQDLLDKHNLPSLAQAIKEIHFPPEYSQKLNDFDTPAQRRFIYEEFLKFEFLILRRRLKLRKQPARAFDKTVLCRESESLHSMLPFKLTSDQSKALAQILEDLSHPSPMNRLLQGDVGSGKTAVAFLAAGSVIKTGSQVALMAPTEILAEQHFKNAIKIMFDRFSIELLTSKTPKKIRDRIASKLTSGEPILIIGTHALIEDKIRFQKLDLVLIDEQHRFGVEQRKKLRSKSLNLIAHTLVLTATPIPRTLALTAYGDLSVSTLREMPPGRQPVETAVYKAGKRVKAFDLVREELKKGRQAYFIYPLVSDSEADGFTSLKSAETAFENLKTEVFPEFQVGLLHGQMKAQVKSEVMERFKNHKIDILVSTTVVEVGVDIPNATVIAIEHAERFGLTQLHQLRGRVGRGSYKSYCILLVSKSPGEISKLRLDILEKTTDGFEIAEADLEIRGPGEFLGTRQSGDFPFKMANLIRDKEWLFTARQDAIELLQKDPELEKIENFRLKKYFELEGIFQTETLTS